MLSGGFGNITLDDRVTTPITVYRNNSQPGVGTQQIEAPLWKVYLNYYLNCIIDNDRAVQTVLNAIKNSVLADRTLVIFTADHGELALSHMGYSRFYQAATTKNCEPLSVTTQQRPVAMPLRQKGPFVYQEDNQLPLVVARLSDKTGSLAIWGQCSGQSMNLNKRGCMRGLFDGTNKYARYFSPHDDALNGAAFAGLSYAQLVAQGQNGQDIQLFRHDTAAGRLETYNSAADSGAPVATLNRSLYNAMRKELKHVTQAPDTVQHVLDGDVVDACA